MNLSDKVTISEKAMARQVGDETVILDLSSSAYFGLDPVGARIWQLMNEDKTLSEICEVMLEEYDVARETIERDVLALAQELQQMGLIDKA
jgi:hypothetical protein